MTLLLAAAAPPALAADRAATLRLTALGFAASSVNASTGTARVDLGWTITDSAASATAITGELTLAVPGSSPGTFLSETVNVPFSLSGNRQVKATGTAQNSSYVYRFHVPRYTQVTPAKWQVVTMTISDNTGNQVSLTGTGLSRFGAVLSATDLVDTTPPSYQDLVLSQNYSPARPYVYVASKRPGVMVYEFNAQDYPAGIGSGSIQVTGPGGRVISTPFTVDQVTGQCGETVSGPPTTDIFCDIPVRYPSGTAPGTWVVSQLTLTDTAGNTATFSGLTALPVSVTSDQVIHVTHVRASPNPINDWAPGKTYTVNVSMTVAGLAGGLQAAYVDTGADGGPCSQSATPPTLSGNTLTVPMQIQSGMDICQVTGIAVLDGADDLSLYASQYGAPDPYLLIRQVPDTVPPTATSASLSLSSIPSSQTANQQVTLSVGVSTVYAPVNGLAVFVYNAAGTKLLYQESGGAGPTQQGVVTSPLPLPPDMPPGTYTIGFGIGDSGGLGTQYGPHGDPMPGGTLQLTVTSG